MEPPVMVEKALERALEEAAGKGTGPLSRCRIVVTPAEGGRFDYLIDYAGRDGKPAGPGFRNLRPVEPRDFDDPKFTVRLLKNLALWLEAMETLLKASP
jgi:hypothetical protein